MPGSPVLHSLLEFAWIYVHWVSDAFYHPLLSSPSAFNLSQHQGLFQWAGFMHQVVKVLEPQLQHQSFQFRFDFLKDGLVWSPCSPRDSQDSPPAPQFESIKSSILNLLYGPTLTFVHDHWMASPTQWTWVWVNSGSWWWTGRPGVLWSVGSQSRTRLSDWTEMTYIK